jgi:tyrosyl-tRNA synthetase
MLLQANDFRHLCEVENVEMQMGGSDQWGNITAGAELIRRRLGRSAYGLTWPLLTRSDGKKMGKSVHGALWLDADKTSPYQFRQYWMQLPDEDIKRFLLQLSLRSVEEIESLVVEHEKAPERRVAQQALADDVTELVHGVDARRTAAEAASILFGVDPTTATASAFAVVAREVPTSKVPLRALADLVSVLTSSGLATSNGEARRLLSQKGIKANGSVVFEQSEDGPTLSGVEPIHGRYILLRRGKTTFHLLEIAEG